jgi:hypothetical protein
MLTPFPTFISLSSTGPVSRRIAPHYAAGSKISLNNRLKIRFIRHGGWTIEAQFAADSVTIFSPWNACQIAAYLIWQGFKLVL